MPKVKLIKSIISASAEILTFKTISINLSTKFLEKCYATFLYPFHHFSQTIDVVVSKFLAETNITSWFRKRLNEPPLALIHEIHLHTCKLWDLCMAAAMLRITPRASLRFHSNLMHFISSQLHTVIFHGCCFPAAALYWCMLHAHTVIHQFTH